MNGFDVYFEARLAFVDRGDVRLRTYDDPARAGVVIEARTAMVLASARLDDYDVASLPPWAMVDFARGFRRAFDRYESRAPSDRLERLRWTGRLA